MVCIRKPDKPCYTECKYHRPLCMINTVEKVMEGILANRIEENTDRRGGLKPMQYGFTKKKGTVGAVERILRRTRTSQEEGYYCVIIAMHNSSHAY